MTRHEYPASASASASTLLPGAEVIPFSPARRNRVDPGTFTKATVRKMQCPPGQEEKFFWDTGCRGFGIRALRTGRRSWIFQYRDEHGRTRRIVLGDVSAVDLEQARNAARRTAASVTHGSNPSLDRKKRRAAGTVLEVIEAYLSNAKGRQKARSYKETERHLRAHAAALHHDRAEAVRRHEISVLLERITMRSGPVAANRVRATLSALWTWGLRTGLIEGESNPVAFTVRNPEKARERVLSDAELKAVWGATDDDADYSRVVRLCLLTGCRREEIAGLRWNEIQDDRIVIDPSRMKGNQAHEIALLPMISSALPTRPETADGCVFGRIGTGFSGFSAGKEKLDAALVKAGMHTPPWGLHDLRRTFSTRLHDAGVEPIVVEALLAHKQQGVAAVYNRASFREAKRSTHLPDGTGLSAR
ncbi:MAG: integrase family protein [Hyphomicrobiales bacterium]|nr:integrase family protein [Hyphomicrobiales bacterium]